MNGLCIKLIHAIYLNAGGNKKQLFNCRFTFLYSSFVTSLVTYVITGFPQGLKKSKILNFKFKALKRLKNGQIFIRGFKCNLFRFKKGFTLVHFQ